MPISQPVTSSWDASRNCHTEFASSYAGCVLETRERNGWDDSDFYAIVWDEDSQSVKNVTYASTRYWSYDSGATVDATPEVIEKALAYVRKNHLAALVAANTRQAAVIAKYKKVKVVTGRKIPVGTIGDVIWMGPCKFNRNRTNIGIRLLSGEVVFTASTNCEVVNPEQYLKPMEALEASAANFNSFVTATPGYFVM